MIPHRLCETSFLKGKRKHKWAHCHQQSLGLGPDYFQTQTFRKELGRNTFKSIVDLGYLENYILFRYCKPTKNSQQCCKIWFLCGLLGSAHFGLPRLHWCASKRSSNCSGEGRAPVWYGLVGSYNQTNSGHAQNVFYPSCEVDNPLNRSKWIRWHEIVLDNMQYGQDGKSHRLINSCLIAGTSEKW